MFDTNIVYATDTYVNFLKFLHVLRGMISDDRARTKYKYMEYASMKICYFRVRHVRTYTICQALQGRPSTKEYDTFAATFRLNNKRSCKEDGAT